MTDQTAPRTLRRMIRPRDGAPYHGYSSPEYAMKKVAEGALPPLYRLTEGGRALAWFEDELIEHQQRVAQRPVTDPVLPPQRRKIKRVRLTPEAIKHYRRLREA
jgi:predicted DNA-binding transcriptional regulator AlpA